MTSSLAANGKPLERHPKNRSASTRRLSFAHALVIILLGAITISGYFILQNATIRLTDTGTILTASRQRWLSQRIALLAVQLTIADSDAERDRLRGAIREQVRNIEAGLDLLLSGELEPTSALSAEMSSIFYDAPFRVEYYTREVIHKAEALIEASNAALVPENDDLEDLLAFNSLLMPGLDRVVAQTREERWDEIELLERLELAMMFGTLTGLGIVLFAIFIPMQRRIQKESRQMIAEIEERQRAETALAESDQRYRSLIAALSEGIVMQDLTGRIVTSNSSAERILGLTAAQMEGRTSTDPTWRAVHEDGSPFPGEDHPAMVTLRTGKEVNNVVMGVHKPDGSLTWININSQPIYGSDTQEMQGVVASFADITERKKFQDELARARDLLQQLMDNSPDSIFMKDNQGRFTACNRAQAEVWGVGSPSEMIGKTLPELFDTEVARSLFEEDRRVFEHGLSVLDRIEIIPNRDGKERVYSVTKVPIFDEHGKLNGLIGIGRDITERKQAETQAIELSRERDKVQVLSDLMRDTSHELRTPLSIINTSLYLVRREDDPIKRIDRIRVVEDQVRHLTMLLEQMQTMSVLDRSGGFVLTATNVAVLLGDLTKSMKPIAEDRGKTLIVDISDKLPMVQINERQMRFAIRHLLDNALHFTGSDGKVTVRAHRGHTPTMDEAVVIEVIDNGIGINSDELPHIFDRFYKVDKARTISGSGAGLGLSMVKKIVDIHRGQIMVESKLGVGSTFRICLPVSTVVQQRT